MKFRGFLLLLCFCKCIVPCSAQQYFNVRDPLHSYTTQFFSVDERNGKYYCAGLVIDSINQVNTTDSSKWFYTIVGVSFSAFDKQGKRLFNTTYQQPYIRNYVVTLSKFCPYKDGFLYFGSTIGNDYTIYTSLLWFDTLGRVQKFREFTKPICPYNYVPQRGYWSVADVKSDKYGNILLLSTPACQTGMTGGYTKMLLTKIDSNFNIIWNKDYGDNVWNSTAWKVIVDSNGYLIAGNLDNNHQNQTGKKSGIELFRTDTSGNVRWHFTKISDSCNVLRDIIRTRDGNYIYCGTGAGRHEVRLTGFNEDVFSVLWMQKIDSAGRPIWQYSPSPIYFNAWGGLTNIIELPDGDVVSAGCLTNGFYMADSIFGNNILGTLVCLNKDGKLKWRRAYSYNNNVDTLIHQIYDLKQTSDGGFIMCGEATASIKPFGVNPIQRGWLLKVDSNGCTSLTDPQCHPTAVPHTPQASAASYQVFPNPAAAQLSIRYSNNDGSSRFLLSDLSGKVLLGAALKGKAGQEQLDVAALSPGIYLYRIISSAGACIAQGKLAKQ